MHQLLIDLAKIGALVFAGAILIAAIVGSGTLGEPFDVFADDDEEDRGGPGYYDL